MYKYWKIFMKNVSNIIEKKCWLFLKTSRRTCFTKQIASFQNTYCWTGSSGKISMNACMSKIVIYTRVCLLKFFAKKALLKNVAKYTTVAEFFSVFSLSELSRTTNKVK